MQSVILVGGRGERMKPLTDLLPKPMLPIKDNPVLWYQLMLLKKHGISDIIICGYYLFDTIKEYFSNGSAFGVSIKYVYEEEPLGTGGALKNAEHEIKEDFIVLNGDVVTNLNIKELVKFHKEKKGIATLVLRETDHPEDSDIVEINNENKVVRFFFKKDKNKVGNLGNTGIFVFKKEILDHIPNEPCILEKDVIAPIITFSPIYGYVSKDYIRDMGTFERYEKIKKDFESGVVGL